MRAFRTLSPWVLSSALLLAACGGSDPDVPGSGSPSGAPKTAGNFTAVVRGRSAHAGRDFHQGRNAIHAAAAMVAALDEINRDPIVNVM